MWVDLFPGLSRMNLEIKTRLFQEAHIRHIAKDKRIFAPGKAPENLLFLIQGTIRVQQVGPNGREIILYRVNAGESCVLTAACLLAYEDYAAEGFAESDITVAALARPIFESLLTESAEFRHFVFFAYSKRVTDLFQLIQEVTFTKIDLRLAQRLLKLYEMNNKESLCISVTQQELAIELGSAREVISRQLKEFERRGWVKLSRGAVHLLNISALRQLHE